MRQQEHRQDHHPSRLRRVLAVALAALAAAAPAAAGRYVALPSPAAGLSPEPPLGGGAAASVESVRHRVTSRTRVVIGVDGNGAPIRVAATQRLDVRVVGDYFFTIGAPVVGVSRTAGSQSSPGYRTGSIVWAGFNPGHRVLGVRAVLDARRAARSLPLRISVASGRTILTNATGVDVSTFAADATRAPLLRYLAQLRSAVARRALPVAGGAIVTTRPVAWRAHVVAPLRVRGTVGGRAVSLVLRGRATIRATGAVRLTATPLVDIGTRDVAKLGGRALLAYTMRTILTVARARQYDAFLGNPDPTGRSQTSYVYRTAERTASPPTAVPRRSPRSYTLVYLAAGVLALAAALAVWARS